jgi:hypothetical protein
MLLSTISLSTIIQYTPQGTRLLLKRLSVPTIRYKSNLYISLADPHPFCQSILLAMNNSKYRVMYSISQLAHIAGKDKKTVLKALHKYRVPLHGRRKKYVLLADRLTFVKKMGI